MKIQVLTRYPATGASSRMRFLQFTDDLKAVGLTPEIAPFVDQAYLDRLFGKSHTRSNLLGHYARRLKVVGTPADTAAIWLEKETLPWLPWQVERCLLRHDLPIISDYDDAVFHRYDEHRNPLVRRVLGSKIDRVMAHSTLVTAGNAYLAERAQNAGAQRIEIVPTVVDLKRYEIRDEHATVEATVKIGWIGTPVTWKAYGATLAETLRPVLEKAGGEFWAIGASHTPTASGTLHIEPWKEETEVEQIRSLGIGVMPLEDTPWARGKCGYKLIQYMACGLPVVASPVGVNCDIVEPGVNGFLATSEAEWIEAVQTLAADPDLRHRMGQAGRRKVEEQYSLQVWGPRVADMIRSIAAGETV